MTARRWWWVAVLGMAALTGVLAIVNLQTPWRLTLALTGIALLVVAWAVVGDRRAESEAPSWTLVLLVTAAAGIGTAGYPTLAILQALAYPISWVFAARSRDAVVGNVLIAVAVGVGFAIGIGTGPEDIIQILVTQSLALGFSLAMGFWITRMVELGEERGRLLTELQGAQEQIAALHRDAGAAAEREHLARELHDTIAQDLTGLVMLAQRARREGAGAVETLALIEENARGVLAETRALVAAGASVETGETRLDLLNALRRIAERFQRETGVTVTVQGPERLVLPRDLEVVVLRCAQEALANARKHARASRIEVGLVAGDGAVRVTVTDDGIGFDPADAPDGFGLPGMRDRLAIVGGSLTVTSAPGEGTRLTAEVRVQELAL
ncbi:MAG: sensor histidine kinase [Actinobacteria bacterium]|nr:sensor histidine kinase [Actinomycetota bacterium]MBU1608508.1 sensor histidine kinase [Actinomycetota bacterium]MBU2316569.1 sensor histidine kinase [Actinomycetota bacterium]MBU2385103.1 sensor histidine kinase [Actinomycetota bacterium]